MLPPSPSSLFRHVSNLGTLPRFTSAVYHDPIAPLWIVEHGAGRPGRSVYFASRDGQCFQELIEVGCGVEGARRTTELKRFSISARRNSLAYLMGGRDPLHIREYRFEREEGGGRLDRREGEGWDLESGALVRLSAEAAAELMRGAAYVVYNRNELRRHELVDFLSGFLAYENARIWNNGWFESWRLERDEVAKVIDGAEVDARSFAALCFLASNYDSAAQDELERYPTEKLADAGLQMAGPRKVVLQRAKAGDLQALEALRVAALTSKDALYDLMRVEGAGEALRSVPIERRRLPVWMLHCLDEKGHPDVARILMSRDAAPYVRDADRFRGSHEIVNCKPVGDLGTMVRYGNQAALDGLYRLYGDGHLMARLMLRELIDEGVLAKSVLEGNVDIKPLAARASEDALAVIALYKFHNDGHPDALQVLRELAPLQGLLEMAGASYNAVGALYCLDEVGNVRVREGINSVSIERWRERYYWRGHGKLDAMDARGSMHYLALLGHEEAARFEGMEIPKRAAAAKKVLEFASELAEEGRDVKIVFSSPAEPVGEEDEETQGDDDTIH